MFKKIFVISLLAFACFSFQAAADETPELLNIQIEPAELQPAELQSTAINCSEDAAFGFQCTEKCPANPAGFKWLQFNCRCEKDTAAGTCTPSGVCHKYTVAGVKVKNALGNPVTAACQCDNTPTAPVDPDEDPFGDGE